MSPISKKNINKEKKVTKAIKICNKLGWKLETKEIPHPEQKLKIICPRGHDCSRSYVNLKSNHICVNCNSEELAQK